jgi:hypothetical protein
MKKMILLVTGLAAAASVGGCARETTRDGLRGAGFGAVGGAVAGALVAEGAAIGAAGGAAVGVATSDGDRRWQRDRRGREYYIDRNGRRVYR